MPELDRQHHSMQQHATSGHEHAWLAFCQHNGLVGGEKLMVLARDPQKRKELLGVLTPLLQDAERAEKQAEAGDTGAA
jgi:hypothetical protein